MKGSDQNVDVTLGVKPRETPSLMTGSYHKVQGCHLEQSNPTPHSSSQSVTKCDHCTSNQSDGYRQVWFDTESAIIRSPKRKEKKTREARRAVRWLVGIDQALDWIRLCIVLRVVKLERNSMGPSQSSNTIPVILQTMIHLSQGSRLGEGG